MSEEQTCLQCGEPLVRDLTYCWRRGANTDPGAEHPPRHVETAKGRDYQPPGPRSRISRVAYLLFFVGFVAIGIVFVVSGTTQPATTHTPAGTGSDAATTTQQKDIDTEPCSTLAQRQYLEKFRLGLASFEEARRPLFAEMILWEANNSLFGNAEWRGRFGRAIAGVKSSAGELRGLTVPPGMREIGIEIELLAGHIDDVASALERWLNTGIREHRIASQFAMDAVVESSRTTALLMVSYCE